MSRNSGQTIALSAVKFKRYLGAAVCQIYSDGKISNIQVNEDWHVEETVRQVEQKFVKDPKTIAGEATNEKYKRLFQQDSESFSSTEANCDIAFTQRTPSHK